MFKKVIILALACLSLNSCGKKDISQSEDPKSLREDIVQKEEINQRDKKEENKEDKEIKGKAKEDPYKESDEALAFYKTIEGKKFTIPSVASLVESIFFYNDGYFDGMIKSGNGDALYLGLYNGKIDYVEKLDDLTYKVKLAKFEMETPTSEKEKINLEGFDVNLTYRDGGFFNGDLVGNEYLIHLPKTQISSLDESTRKLLSMVGKASEGDTTNIYLIKGLSDRSGVMYEFIRED